MPVPEAAVHKNHGAVFGHDKIRPARKRTVLRAVHRETVAKPVEHCAQCQFGLGVASPDAGHDL